MQQIKREAGKVLKEINDEMDIERRKYHLPDSTIVLGTAGVYIGWNDFCLQQISGHFSVLLHPKNDRSNSEIFIMLSGNKKQDDGVTVQFRAEDFKLVEDKAKKFQS